MNPSNKNGRIKHYILGLAVVLAGVLLDQWTKHLAIVHLKDQNPFVIIPKVFQLTYLENRGAAFGMLQNQKGFFIISAAIILCVVVWFYLHVPMNRHFLPMRICATLISAGAIGNLIDRVRLNYVVDFFYFELIDFPVFNVADIFVTVSTIILALFIMFFYKEEDLAQIFHRGA